jgi:HEAT repeat protein
MISERPGQEQPSTDPTKATDEISFHLQPQQSETVHAALALLLGPETDYHMRVRATRRLAKQGPLILPLLLTTLSNYPEITTPAWPWWPPQYEHSSRLLIHLSRQAQIGLAELLQHPTVTQPVGPVLWISVIEAAALQVREDHETLLRQSLEAPWATVRYAGAMALAIRAREVPLQRSTIETLRTHLGEHEEVSVQLTVACALLASSDNCGLEALAQFTRPIMPEEVRKAAMFILATELPAHISDAQRQDLASCLIPALFDPNPELALQAAHALSNVALPAILPTLKEMLDHDDPQRQCIILTVLEEMARKNTLRRMIRYHALPTQIALLLKADTHEVRRQASYALAACGGEYAAAVFGTILLNREHPGYLEAIEGLRVFQGILRAPIRVNVVRWLLRVLRQPQEEVQVAVLDSLAYILLQARRQGKKQAWYEISNELLRDGMILELLDDTSAWVRQRAVELLGIVWGQPTTQQAIYMRLLQLLHNDNDAGVRACVAFICGHSAARWTIPDLIQALLDPDEHVAETAFHSLCQLTGPDDPLFVYIVKELVHYGDMDSATPHPLAQSAHTLLTKWNKSKRKEGNKTLHSSS